MYLNILKKDLKRKKAMNIILLIFIIIATMFVSSSVNNIISVTTALDDYLEMADAPDYLTMTINKTVTSDIDEIIDSTASIEKYEGYEVPVLIWELQPSDEKSLDIYEGYPSYYRKEMLEVEVKGKRINAMVYIMNTNKEHIPSDYYYRVLEQGYERFGFDKNILEQALLESKEW